MQAGKSRSRNAAVTRPVESPGKGFARHAKSKEHLSGVAAWKERELRCSTGSEISTLINSDQLSRNRVYVAGIVDTITFLALN